MLLLSQKPLLSCSIQRGGGKKVVVSKQGPSRLNPDPLLLLQEEKEKEILRLCVESAC